jgi:glycosyltransferase involved in cell wall biosynthesis
MIREFSGGSFDLVHCNDADTLPAGSALKRRGAARELLYDAHEYWPGMGVEGSIANRSIRRLEAAGIEDADYVVTVNPLIAEMMRRDYRLDRTPSVVMNCPRLDPGPDPEDTVHRPVRVLYQGRVQAFRGVEQLVLAFHHLEGAELTVAGDGSLLERCRLLASSEGLEDRVHFTGRYAPEQTLSIVREHDIGVLPFGTATVSITYSSPNKLFDYAMGGLAIASSDLPFMRAVIREHRLGMIFPDNRPESIADALREMIRDPERLGEYKRNARRVALERFSWEKQFAENYPWGK